MAPLPWHEPPHPAHGFRSRQNNVTFARAHEQHIKAHGRPHKSVGAVTEGDEEEGKAGGRERGRDAVNGLLDMDADDDMSDEGRILRTKKCGEKKQWID